MQAIREPVRQRTATVLVTVPFALATLIDVASRLGSPQLPRSAAAAVSWTLIAAGIGLGCVVLMLRILQRNRWPAGLVRPLRRSIALELIAIGLMLGSLVLRGHREIPPDPPLLAAQLIGLALLLAALRIRASASRAATPQS
jgi:hypothetical protein